MIPALDLQSILHVILILDIKLSFNVISLAIIRSFMSLRSIELRLSILIFYFLIIILELVNFALLGHVAVCQSCTINKSYRTDRKTVVVDTISYLLGRIKLLR